MSPPAGAAAPRVTTACWLAVSVNDQLAGVCPPRLAPWRSQTGTAVRMSSEVSASTATDDDDDVPVGLGVRLRQIVAVPGRLLAALFLPDKGVPRMVTTARYGAPLAAVILCG